MSNNTNCYKGRYKKIEITFNTFDDNEMNLYYYILQKSVYLGKAKFIKNMLNDIKNKESKQTDLV